MLLIAYVYFIYLFDILLDFHKVVNNIVYEIMYCLNFFILNIYILFFIFLFFNSKSGFYVFLAIFLVFYNRIVWINVMQLTNWPVTLIYGFNLLHPILFYTTVCFTWGYFYKTQILQQITLKVYFFVGLSALLLGMFWGGLNEIWGFFWTYDQVELALLFLLSLLIYYIHSTHTYKSEWHSVYMYVSFISYLMCLRFNIIFTVHSFFENNTIPFFFFFEVINFFMRWEAVFIVSYFAVLYIYIYIIFQYFLYFFISIKFSKKVIYLHFFVILIVLLITNLTYYYNILTTTKFFINDVVQTSAATYSTFFSQIYLFKQITLSLNTTINTSYFLNHINHYTYIYYLGFFFFIFIIFFTNKFKFYTDFN